ncbi:MAG: Gfo/Idh/MocA family oxidoreductase [Planctomycetota bacterium]|nr:Gfo/Idh/MocA family oxidoreductase [Planctomycetota bacterium]
MPSKVRVGLVGSQFISSIHADALQSCADAELLAIASPTEAHVKEFADRFGIPHRFTDYRAMLELADLDMIVIGAPNRLHCQITLDAALAGKHVVCEKPLCMNLGEADSMIEACDLANVKLMYAEALCFAPKYVRLKKLLDDGEVGYLELGQVLQGYGVMALAQDDDGEVVVAPVAEQTRQEQGIAFGAG